MPFFDHPFARDGPELFDHPVDACIREGRVTEAPLTGPGQEKVGHVRQQDQSFLGRQPLRTPSVRVRAPLSAFSPASIAARSL